MRDPVPAPDARGLPPRASGAHEFEVDAVGPFDFVQSARFLETWAPARDATATDASIDYAFCSEIEWSPVAVSVTGSTPGGGLRVRVNQPVGAEVRGEVARMFSLDVDGSGFADVGRRDPLIGELLAQRPGLRPVCFWSTWEAAVWALLSQRTSMRQAASAKSRMAHELGASVTLGGREHHAFPAPARLLSQPERARLPEVKLRWLCGLAEAALEGLLDASHLRSLSGEAAIAELRQLEGVGPFSAALIAARGAGHPDLFTTSEPRLASRMQAAYGEQPGAGTIAEAWRPFRSWCAFLIRSATDDQLAAARQATVAPA